MQGNHKIRFRALLSFTALATTMAAGAALAQEVPEEVEAVAEQSEVTQQEEPEDVVVVTGTRIRRTQVSQSVPTIGVDDQVFSDYGYTSAAGALNQITSNAPLLNQADGSGESSGSGQQPPNLFNLGPGRTLTLVNGRRMVSTSVGIGESTVDANIMPTGLIDRIEVVQAGGAAVYGSGAIAGVVNYVFRDDFEGIEFDAQIGESDRGDYFTPRIRGTFGKNFADGRGNIALNVEWSQAPILAFSDRPLSNLSRLTQGNPDDTGPNDGIPSVQEVIPAHFWNFNRNGVIFNAPAPPPMFLTRLDGTPLQFASDGSVMPYDPGNILGIPFAEGGEGFRYSDLAGLRSGVERLAATSIAHYDLTPDIRVSAELLYANTEGEEIPQGNSRTVLNPPGSGAGPIAFTINNPFLTEEAISTLSAANAAFAQGAPLFLSKYFYDFVPSAQQTHETDVYRGVLAVEGDFEALERDFYWTLSGSYGRVEGGDRSWQVINSRYNNAIAAARSGGEIVCAINADADPSNDDPACAPINPFGAGNVSQAARDYISTIAGVDYVNRQADLLATLGGTVVEIPGGDVQFSLAYEHRDEEAEFTPLPANQQGLFGTGVTEEPQSGGFNTDELSGEILVPLVGGDFTLPFVQELELNGVYRFVDNSIAGQEDVWNLGARWQPVDSVTVRGSRSRNFRAPSLSQLFAPSSTALGAVGEDPCDADRISSGPNPDVRYANCLAEFQANPMYGVDPDGTGAGLSAEERLARFQDPAENFQRALITTGGNPDLRNEISDTLTYGVVFEPPFIPGLTLAVDRIEVDLQDGLSLFTTENFTAACYDAAPQPPEICDAFTRLPAPDDLNPGGAIVEGRTTTFNAGVIKYRGEVYNVNYSFPLDELFGGERDLGDLALGLEATHTSLLTTSVTGATFTRTDDTVEQPTWRGRFDAHYSKGPLRLNYQLIYLGETRAGPDATIENNPNPIIDRNIRHTISGQYDFGRVVLRAGIRNLTDEGPSYPSLAYGDILGRRYFVGAQVRF